MARLNESTAAAEPIEILKRRFVRQNREIARVNSIQSLRIRGLESEVSHLLSENVSLREQVITLTQELERLEAAKALCDGIYRMKSRLDSKLVELGSLVTELGSLPRQFSKTTRETAVPEPKTTAERQSKQSSSINHSNSADCDTSLDHYLGGRLPVILEDKYYPRRTLEARETQQLSDDFPGVCGAPASEDAKVSPELSIEHDTSPTIDMPTLEEYAMDEHSIPPSLETRRKKKASSVEVDEDKPSEETISLFDSKLVRKCVTKRKFSADEEEGLFESAEAENDGFEFTRPVRSPTKPNLKIDQSPAKRRPQPRVRAASAGQSKRKVLEPKNANISMTSPTKSADVSNCGKVRIPTVLGKDENSHQIQGTQSSLRKRGTVVCDDKMSAMCEEPRRKAELHMCQPPFQDDNHDVPAMTEITKIRPSRRQRAVVSYAEPNLRDKMRRSTNELGPAVGRDHKRRSSSRAESIGEQRNKDDTMEIPLNHDHAVAEPETIATGAPASHSKWRTDNISRRESRNSSRPFADPANDAVGDSCPNVVFESKCAELGNVSTVLPDDEVSRGGLHVSVPEDQYISTVVGSAVIETGRKSRRHSSNIMTSKGCTIPVGSAGGPGADVDSTELAGVHDTENVYIAVNPRSSDTSFVMSSREMTRGQRVAARRRSMML
ncbi:hypothetical protein BJX64DRAFT_264088 [Aspergillus heterothallicus]